MALTLVLKISFFEFWQNIDRLAWGSIEHWVPIYRNSSIDWSMSIVNTVLQPSINQCRTVIDCTLFIVSYLEKKNHIFTTYRASRASKTRKDTSFFTPNTIHSQKSEPFYILNTRFSTLHHYHYSITENSIKQSKPTTKKA